MRRLSTSAWARIMILASDVEHGDPRAAANAKTRTFISVIRSQIVLAHVSVAH